MDFSGSLSPNRTNTMRTAAMIQTASSLQTSAVIELDTPKARKVRRSEMNPKSEIKSPAHVKGEIFERIRDKAQLLPRVYDLASMGDRRELPGLPDLAETGR
jgi:hypothetical protein